MLFPSKVISYNESILPKLPLVLRYLEQGPKKITEVYRFMHGSVTDIIDLFEVLDCLYSQPDNLSVYTDITVDSLYVLKTSHTVFHQHQFP